MTMTFGFRASAAMDGKASRPMVTRAKVRGAVCMDWLLFSHPNEEGRPVRNLERRFATQVAERHQKTVGLTGRDFGPRRTVEEPVCLAGSGIELDTITERP